MVDGQLRSKPLPLPVLPFPNFPFVRPPLRLVFARLFLRVLGRLRSSSDRFDEFNPFASECNERGGPEK